MKQIDQKNQFIKWLKLPLIIFTISFFISCDDDDEGQPQIIEVNESISDLVITDSDFDILEAALQAANLVELFDEPGEYTVFAPTDSAFEAAGISESTISSMPVDYLAYLLQYHVIGEELTAIKISAGNRETLSSSRIPIVVNGDSIALEGANIIESDILASNGVIHKINRVLTDIEPSLTEGLEVLDLTILLDAISKAEGVSDTLAKYNDFTFFAPTNQALENFLDEIGQNSLDNIPEDILAEILRYHLVRVKDNPLSEFELINFNTLISTIDTVDLRKSVNSGTLTLSLNPDSDNATVITDNFNLVTEDLITTNGIVHVIDKVLIPPSIKPILNTVVEPAYFNKNFSTLVEAVLTADPSVLQTLLDENGNYTLFAPTNAAFDAAGIDDLSAVSDLEGVLRYHLIGDDAYSAEDVMTTDQLSTANGEEIFFSTEGSNVFINGETLITAVDIATDNGVVHVIDRTLLPPTQSIADIVTTNSDFSILTNLIGRAANLGDGRSVAQVLSDVNGEFTVFAPTDQAFERVPQATLDALTATEIRDVLLYHLIGDVVFYRDLTSGPVTTVLGSTLDVDPANNLLTDAQNRVVRIVPATNVLANNGIIHYVNNVLLP